MLYAKNGNTLVQLLHCLSLSSCQLESTPPPTAQLLQSQSQQGDLVGHHLWLSTSLSEFFDPAVNHFTHKHETFLYKYPSHRVLLPIKMHNRMLLFGSILLRHSHHFDYWNQPLNMHVCYLDCHEAGLCCYLVIHTENLLYPLQLFYLHLWPIYWLSLIYGITRPGIFWSLKFSMKLYFTMLQEGGSSYYVQWNFNSEIPDFDFTGFTCFLFCPSKIVIRTMLNFNQFYVYSNSMIFWNLYFIFQVMKMEI
jgi:hypothetical protein